MNHSVRCAGAAARKFTGSHQDSASSLPLETPSETNANVVAKTDRPMWSVVIFSSAQLLALAAGLLLQVLIARNLFLADYGRFVVANTILLALTLGLVSAVPKALGRLVSIDDRWLRKAWYSVWIVQFPISCAAAFLLWCLSGQASSLLHDDGLSLVFQLIAIELVVRAGLLEPAWLLLNGLRYHRTQAILMLTHSVLRVGAVGLALAGGVSLSRCVLASACASVLSLVIVIPVIVKAYQGKGSPLERISNRSLSQELLNWIRLAPVAEFLNYIIVVSNLWILKSISRDATEIGVYAACFMLAQAVLPFGIAMSRGTFATFTMMLDQNRVDDVRDLLRQTIRTVFIIASCAVSVAYVLGSSIVYVFFGTEYHDSGSLLGILVAGTFGIAIVWILGDVLNAAGQLRTRLVVMVGLGLFAITSYVPLIHTFGSIGAAWGLFLTGGIGAFTLCCVMEFRFPGCIPRWTATRSIASAAISIFVCAAFFRSNNVGDIVVGAIVVLAINSLSLLVLREWSYMELCSSVSAVRNRLGHGPRYLKLPKQLVSNASGIK